MGEANTQTCNKVLHGGNKIKLNHRFTDFFIQENFRNHKNKK